MLLRQSWTLTRKNLIITLLRHPLSTVFAAFILPVCVIAFLAYARNLFVPPSNFGVGSPVPVRTLADGLNAATGGRNRIAFVNSGLYGGDIDRVVDNLLAQVATTGATPYRLETETELLDVCRSTLRGSSTCYGAVVFRSSPSEGPGGYWNYTLRNDGAFGTSVDVGRTDNEVEVYLLPLQRAVDSAIISLNTTAAPNALGTTEEFMFTSMTEEEKKIDIRVRYQTAIINVIGVAFLIGMADITYTLTGFIATERELGMSQLIEAMMPNIARWHPQFARIFSYHLAFDLLYIPGWIIVALILGGGVFAETSKGIVILFHILTGLSLTSFSIFGASFFKKAQLSGITCYLVTLILGILAQVIGKSGTATVAILSFLFPSCNYIYFTILMARYERQELGMNLIEAAPENTSTLPGIALWAFMVIQIIFYPVLGAIIERSFYGTASKGREVVRGIDSSPSLSETVQLQGFSKHYKPNWFRRKFAGITGTQKETVIAVNDLSLSARQGQILVLLGANGSGKSTTLDAIAGLNKVTSGSIKVDGTGGLGIAPQKNVLWDELTVEEHVRIFNHLKAPGHHDSKQSIRQLIEDVDLDRKISARAKTLSGGQKRKLQLGMMFTGGSAVCCVDEVSSGLDPLSRRKIWDILLAERGARSIILTTHFLDEADLLADQIVILSKGTLRAQGSSVELKDKLGGGYRIHLSTGPGSAPAPQIDEVQSHTTFGQTMYSACDSRQAAQIIRRLESDGLSDYNLSGPTIEDVFLQLADEVRADSGTSVNEEQNEKGFKARATMAPQASHRDLDLHTGQPIGFFRQAWVLFRKRLTILRRNYLPYIAALLLPIIAAGLVTLFVKDQVEATCSPPGLLDYDDTNALYTQLHYNLVVGPASKWSNETIITLFRPLLPAGVMNMIPTEAVAQFIHLVDTLPQFNEYISRNYSTVRPAGVFLGDEDSPPTFAYKGDRRFIYSGVFGQNIMDIMLSNISISTQQASFDLAWAADTGSSLQLTTYFALAMAAYPGFFTLYPTIERMRNIRGLEYSNGVRSSPLWLAYAAFDFIPVLLSSAISVAIFASVSSVWYHVEYLFLIFILYGLASILLAYVISLFAKTQLAAFAYAAAGQAIMFLIYMIAYLCILTYAPVNKIDSALITAHFVISVIAPIPNLLRALFLTLNLFSATCDGKQLASNPGGILQYGGPILYLILQIVVLFLILLWSDSGSIVAFYRRFRKQPEVNNQEVVLDEEIAEELARVSSSNDGLRVLNLTKSFGKLTAVDNMTFGIKRGEVFALLGPNGAGKSTTISLIRGDIQPSKNGGNIFVENVEINRHRAQARSHLGVCPQYDAMDQMTVVEHLRFYARVRGVPDVEHNVQEVIRAVGLSAFSSRMAAKLSGGNKRKLSLGIALIGNPTVLLLDEPSSGMDAAAKRVMWKTLAAVVPGRSLLLTTHSMEEADALADRAGIMAKRMLAMGTSDGLRRKHGDAYYVHLVMKSAPHTTTEETQQLKDWVLRNFPGADIEDKTYHGQIRFSVPVSRPKPDVSDDEISAEVENGIGSIITLLEDHRESLGLEHYAVSPTTLDQVFLTIVGKHNVEEEGYSKQKDVKGWKKWFGMGK